MPYTGVLPEDLQAQVDFEAALNAPKNEHQLAMQRNNAKLEALRMAKDIAMENHRTAPAGTVLTATDILAIAADLEAFTAS